MIAKALLLLLAVNAFGCSVVSSPNKVARVFAVNVRNDLGPVAGLKLRVYRFKSEEWQAATPEESTEPNKFEDVIARAVTDANGKAQFALDRTGDFWLDAEGTSNVFTQQELIVADSHTDETVAMRWPGQTIIEAARPRGQLLTGLRSAKSAPIADRGLVLRTALNYAPIATTRTKDNGSFDFDQVAPGLYFVQIEPTPSVRPGVWDLRGDIALRIDPTLSRQIAVISTEYTTCGLGYVLEENKAPYRAKCLKDGKMVPCDE